jgi:amidase
MGFVKGLPVGLSFIGPKWADWDVLSLGYSYEQARGALPTALFFRSIEDSPAVAPFLKR